MKHFQFVLVSLILAVTTIPGALGQQKPSQHKDAGSTLRIVKDSLIGVPTESPRGYPFRCYVVKGSIYNPNNIAVKNVVVRYYIWKKFMGKDGHGEELKRDGGYATIEDLKRTGGLVYAIIKYLPPKQTADFIATGDFSESTGFPAAPTFSDGSELFPGTISAEISAEWDK
jgi:hypothetical protein